jgi:hypothetical protein
MTKDAPQRQPPDGIDFRLALEIARDTIKKTGPTHDFVIQTDRTIERPFGWIFFYAPRKFLDTGERRYLVPGSAPLVVYRSDGSTESLSTSLPPDKAIEGVERRWHERATR